MSNPILKAMLGNGDTVAEVLYGRHVANEGVKAFLQSILRGRIDAEDARAMLEHGPRLANAIMDGLSVSGYGDVTPRRFIELAAAGTLVAGAVSRALSA